MQKGRTINPYVTYTKIRIRVRIRELPPLDRYRKGVRSFEHISSFCLLALYHMHFLFAICILYFCGFQVFTIISPPTGLYGNSSSNLLTACLIFSLISCSFDIRSIGFLLKYSTYSFAPP